ncbi:MAG TPA: hypothetical protein VFK48_12165 [Usitatibacter sp.]|nr:hypothetical protein [Usitatibacter sp.]
MASRSLHPGYLHFSQLPYSLRVVYTAALCILGLGYLFALVYLFHTYSGKDGDAKSVSYEDMVIAYSGSGKDSRMEAALRGSMAVMLPKEESAAIVSWIQKGSDRAAFEGSVRPVLEKRCMTCHDGSNPHLPNLNGYDNVKKSTEKDTGTPLFTLVRVSHIHLFGLTFIFFLVGTIFSHAYLRPVWLKCAIVALPFLSIAVDVLSWYVTKYYHPFAYVVMASGAVTGLCFGFMWVVSVWQMWIGRTPAAVAAREGGAAAASVG